ncbi:hypothetical protein ACEWY4_014396 [Coilia grayii]|uniref:Fibronectin type-III domain-containing protein n=1 Tax=Coilia grayii TaxID=363190 RepID=A0ABD1JS66_9TELE
MLTVFITLVLASHGVACLSLPGVSADPYEDAPWRTALCCELPAAGHPGGDVVTPTSDSSAGSDPGGTALNTNQLRCHPSNSTVHSSSVVCLNLLCWLDEEKENLICVRKLQSASADRIVTISLRRWPEGADTEANTGVSKESPDRQCTADDRICSVALESLDANVSVIVNVTDAKGSTLSPAMHIATKQLNPPGNLHYTKQLLKTVVLRWSPPQPETGDLRYQVRYFSSKQPGWQLVPPVNDSWQALGDLSANTLYTAQVRSQSLHFQEQWSNWSQPLYLCLSADSTCYMPEVVFTSPGSEVTVYCTIQSNASNARWWLNGKEKVPESQYQVISEHVSAVTWRPTAAGVDTLLCCEKRPLQVDHCSPAYAKVYTTGSHSTDISCETTLDSINKMTCTWSKSIWSNDQLMYTSYDGPCEDMQKKEELVDSNSQVDKCPAGGSGQLRRGTCEVTKVRLIACYKLWLEEVGGQGKVKSHPVYVTPMDWVKLSPPTVVEAVSMPNGTLSLEWTHADWNVFKLEYRVRYTSAVERANPMVMEPQLESWAEVVVPEPCVVYKVEVCCRRHNGSGNWSEWSEPRDSVIENSHAPEEGPVFWRQFKEDPEKNQVNVTLLFKPLPIVDPPRCVEGLVVQHQASGGAVWSSEMAVGATHTFLLGEEPLAVTVVARNSVGHSTKNSNLVLTKRPKRQSVQTFTGRVINSTCVDLAWVLLLGGPAPVGFVVEWLDHSWEAAGKVQWIRVPPAERAVYLHGHFYSAEQYRFTLYTLYEDGEGKPAQFISSRDDPAAYMLLLIIVFLAVVLFVTLVISQNQIKKLMWKDVPDPNKCSWAQDVNFKKMENIESLFRHPDGLTACPLLLVSEVISEAEIVEKTVPTAFKKEQELGGVCEETTAMLLSRDPLSDSATGLISGGSSGISETPESSGQSSASGQSSVTYATVLLNNKPCRGRHHKQNPENLSNSSDEGNFSANNSDISGSFSGGLWELEQSDLEPAEADHRHSCSYNSVEEEFSEAFEEEDEVLAGQRVSSQLYYLGISCQDDDDDDDDDDNEEEDAGDGDDEDEEEDEPVKLEESDVGSQTQQELLVCGEAASESECPLSRRESKTSCASQTGLPLYLPQFRTALAKPSKSWSEDDSSPL